MERKEAVTQFKIFWVSLDPAQGSEMAKTRPCVVISPDEMNNHLRTVMASPLTSTMKAVPSRVKVYFNGQYGMVALDHIRTVDKNRINGYMGKLEKTEIEAIKETLQEMFS
ncbi:MAG: type II toxin-antitoxin system PemK/MazF family toxin [Tannerellaceae bacterium]|jgi:mRNA interferase MazF|nr:type II toxin-antitoxin system PemK/MazF family toxin [Tannerellaceae bacterium]